MDPLYPSDELENTITNPVANSDSVVHSHSSSDALRDPPPDSTECDDNVATAEDELNSIPLLLMLPLKLFSLSLLDCRP